MQDAYVGDIGDYGKYGLLRAITDCGLILAVNWYRVIPKGPGKQEDGKYIHYLRQPKAYRGYDPALYDKLEHIVNVKKVRTLEEIENAGLFPALFSVRQSDPNGRRGTGAAWRRRRARMSYSSTQTTGLQRRPWSPASGRRKSMSSIPLLCMAHPFLANPNIV